MALGWGAFFGAIGKILGKVPIQDRKERWKNEMDKLTNERRELLRSACDEKSSNRLLVVDKRIDTIHQWLRNSSSSD